jgi:hypothetical protein
MPASGRAGLSGLSGRGFHDQEGFTTPGSIKVFAIMESAGMLHDREDFCPISGGKTFRDHEGTP